jgi:hypothetical protein
MRELRSQLFANPSWTGFFVALCIAAILSWLAVPYTIVLLLYGFTVTATGDRWWNAALCSAAMWLGLRIWSASTGGWLLAELISVTLTGCITGWLAREGYLWLCSNRR